MCYAFMEQKPGATHIEIRLARPKPKDQAFLDHVGAEFQKTITAEIEKLRQMLEGRDAGHGRRADAAGAGGALPDRAGPRPLTMLARIKAAPVGEGNRAAFIKARSDTRDFLSVFLSIFAAGTRC
jgi:hypothetical protein